MSELRRHGPHPMDQPGEGPVDFGPEGRESEERVPATVEEEQVLSPEEIEQLEELSEEDIVEIDVDDEENPVEVGEEDIVDERPAPVAAEAPEAETAKTPEEKERERLAERQALKDALTSPDLEPEAMLEMLAKYDRKEVEAPAALDDLAAIADEYGLDVKDLDDREQKRLLIMFNGIRSSDRESATKNMADVLERAMHERLADQALQRIDRLELALARSPDPESLRSVLNETMRSLSAVATQIRAAQGGLDEQFMAVVKRYNQAVGVKRRLQQDGVPEEVRSEVKKAFDDTFEEHKDFIEDDIVAFEFQRMRKSGGHGSVEHMMRKVYGLDSKEVEERKEKNRERVVEEIKKMTDQPYVTAEMIEKLHAVNNDGLMPRETSKLRDDPDSAVFFGRAKRLGVLGQDVKAAVEEILDRANDLIDRNALGKVSGVRYQMEAAGLHNDLLDVHPFVDRNGSTSLLFLELMMARRGNYEPPAKRETSFYKKLSRTVGYNPAAVAAVGYEMVKMRYKPGFYEGGLSEERRTAHQKLSDRVQQLRKMGKV